MTIPFYTQGELDAALAKQRLQIAAVLKTREAERRAETVESHGTALVIDELADELHAWADVISKGNFPRPLVVESKDTP